MSSKKKVAIAILKLIFLILIVVLIPLYLYFYQQDFLMLFRNFNDIVSYLKQNAEDNDIVLTLGAGTVTQIGPMLVD